MLEKLIVVGAGGSAADVACLVEEMNHQQERWHLLGFLDDDPAKHGQSIAGYPVLGSIPDHTRYPDCRFVINLAHYRRRLIRKLIAERMALPIDRYATLIHPRACVSRGATVGAGSIIFENAVISYHVTLGNHAMIHHLCFVGHNATVEDCATMAPTATLCGFGRLCAGAYAGAGSTISDGVIVGAGAMVGLGAVVIREVPANTTVVGNPARAISERGRQKEQS